MKTPRLLALAGALLCALAIAATAPARAADAADEVAGEMMRAIKQDNPSRLAGLLRQGADPNTRDPRGVPGLYVALQEGSLEAARTLMASPRLKPDLATPTDETPLMMAALKGQRDIALALIAKGAQVNRPGWTPLHYAATGTNLAMIRLLLDRRAVVDSRSPNGTTPLMMAARYGSPEAVQMLLRAGADPRARNQLAMDARDFAVSGERPDIAELITQARRNTPVRAAQPPASAALPVAQQITPPAPPSVAEQITPPAFSPVAGPLPAPGQAQQLAPASPGQPAQIVPAPAAQQSLPALDLPEELPQEAPATGPQPQEQSQPQASQPEAQDEADEQSDEQSDEPDEPDEADDEPDNAPATPAAPPPKPAPEPKPPAVQGGW